MEVDKDNLPTTVCWQLASENNHSITSFHQQNLLEKDATRIFMIKKMTNKNWKIYGVFFVISQK